MTSAACVSVRPCSLLLARGHFLNKQNGEIEEREMRVLFWNFTFLFVHAFGNTNALMTIQYIDHPTVVL